jgi:hypothetical protein
MRADLIVLAAMAIPDCANGCWEEPTRELLRQLDTPVLFAH